MILILFFDSGNPLKKKDGEGPIPSIIVPYLYFCGYMIELRSDTFTRPTPAMLNAMLSADVGDDVFGEDSSINKLEQYCVELFNMESALFCPSGTMANQIAIKCHTQPGNEVICEQMSHVYVYEGGGIAFNSGCQVKPLVGERGLLKADQIAAAINNDDIHKPVSALISIENTSNRGGGSCYDFDELKKIRQLATQHQIPLHLDGARLWNALAVHAETPADYGKLFDSISVCLSKGLGAPVGSVLLGTRSYIQKARRVRKVLGGGMRQAGYLAAAGLYALENHRSRLSEDHEHARKIAAVLQKKAFVAKVMPVETNMVIFETISSVPAAAIAEKLKQQSVLCIAIAPNMIRMVTHLDVTAEMIERLQELLERM